MGCRISFPEVYARSRLGDVLEIGVSVYAGAVIL
jgi:hypothetical protein